MTISLNELWDYDNPGKSEQRFRDALQTASADESVILQTQIARTYGIRRDFYQAKEILAGVEPHIQQSSIQAQVYYYLELGRTYCSATHPPETQTAETKEKARSAFLRAFDLAQEGQLDSLAIDALHMMAFVEQDAKDQIMWNRKAITILEGSSQPDAGRWAGSLHNNLGYALYMQGMYDEALLEFNLALTAHKKGGNPGAIRIAFWMIAWTLRALGRLSEALEIQLRLEKECDQAGEPDAYVFEELEQLYQALNDNEKAGFYANRRKSTQS